MAGGANVLICGLGPRSGTVAQAARPSVAHAPRRTARTLRAAGDILAQGKTVLIFPEGTRSPDGQIKEFKRLFAHLALTHDVDILPMYLRGTHDSMPKGGKLPTKRDLSAHIGPPLRVVDLVRLAKQVEDEFRGLNEEIHIAVMGCEVNGPGEARAADIGVAGGRGIGLIFKGGEVIRKVPEAEIVSAMREEVDKFIAERKQKLAGVAAG